MGRYERLLDLLHRRQPDLELRLQEPMEQHTTFRVGGPAALMALPTTEEETLAAIQVAVSLDIWPLFVGNGSNLLVDDGGLDAFVIKTVPGLGSCTVSGLTLTGMSGVRLSRFAEEAGRQGLTGLEFAHGIPGSLGGGVVMNAGAYAGEMSHVISSVRAVDRSGAVRTVSGPACAFGYRHSVFSGGDCFVLSATVQLSRGNVEEIARKMRELMERRRAKQPLEYASAGSTFKRPRGHFAAALIEHCGLKGLSVGAAQVSEKHAGFVINRGGASCQDILTLMEQVQERVYRETGVVLEPEVRYWKQGGQT